MKTDNGVIEELGIGSKVMEDNVDYICCGKCKVIAEKVDIISWPSKLMSTGPRCSHASITSQTNLLHSKLLKERDEANLGKFFDSGASMEHIKGQSSLQCFNRSIFPGRFCVPRRGIERPFSNDL